MFISGKPNLSDVGSTNSSFINGREIVAGEFYPLNQGDVLKFGCSTREYHVSRE